MQSKNEFIILKKSYQDSVDSMKTTIESLRVAFIDLHSQFESLKNSHYINVKTHQEVIDEFKKKIISEINAFIADMKTNFYEISHDIELIQKKMLTYENLPSMTDKIKSKLDSILPEVNRFKSELYDQNNQFRDSIRTLVEEFKQNILNKPSEIPSLKSDFDAKLKNAYLDLENANIRTQNLEKQILFMEKKIENVMLLVKKIELDKREQ